MMSPILRSVRGRWAVSRRNICSSPSTRGDESTAPGIRFVQPLTGFGLGFAVAVPVVGDNVARLEEQRQKKLRETLGESAEIVDLREKMWNDIGKRIWTHLKEIYGKNAA